MQLSSRSRVVLFGLQGLLVLTLWSCGGDSDNGAGQPPASSSAVTIAGKVDDGTLTSPEANATCRFVDSSGTQGTQATTDRSGEMIPTRGFVEVSPRATVIAALIAREQPANRQARQDALFTALNSGDPALTALVEAAVTLYQPLQTAGIDVNFDAAAGESGGGTGSAGGGGTGDPGSSPDGGASGAVGDGAELSPIPNAVCTFALQV